MQAACIARPSMHIASASGARIPVRGTRSVRSCFSARGAHQYARRLRRRIARSRCGGLRCLERPRHARSPRLEKVAPALAWASVLARNRCAPASVCSRTAASVSSVVQRRTCALSVARGHSLFDPPWPMRVEVVADGIVLRDMLWWRAMQCLGAGGGGDGPCWHLAENGARSSGAFLAKCPIGRDGPPNGHVARGSSRIVGLVRSWRRTATAPTAPSSVRTHAHGRDVRPRR